MPNGSTRARAIAAFRGAVALPIARPNEAPAWHAGARVVLALYAPLLIGLAVGNVGASVPFAVGALVAALVDPGGSWYRRSIAIGATALAGAAAFAVGEMAGGSPAAAVGLVLLVVSLSGLAPEFGDAGTRAGLHVAVLGIIGVASSGVDPGWISPVGLVVGAVWPLALALGPFRQQGRVGKDLPRRARSVRRSFVDHVMLRTAMGRHGARMAIAAGLGVAFSLALGREHLGWVAFATMAMLHPEVTAATKQGVRLLAGTILGGLAAVAVVQFVGPGAALLAVVAPALLLSVSLRSVDDLYYTVAATAFWLALTSFEDPSGWSLFDARAIDTVVGIAIAGGIWRLTMPAGERARLATELEVRRG